MPVTIHALFAISFAFSAYHSFRFAAALRKPNSKVHRYWQARSTVILRTLQIGMPLMAVALGIGVVGNVLLAFKNLK
ncbi:MAG: hypothetical protein ACRESS_06025 [Stenotrophobium sp.]